MAKHQSKPQVYITDYKKTTLTLQSADKKVGEASDINKGFVVREIY